MKVAIDARSISSSTGTYVRNLVRQLQYIDRESSYTIFVPEGCANQLAFLRAPNFRVREVNAPPFSAREQFRFLSTLQKGRFDVVHFAMPQQPLLYPRRRLTTFHDLTLIKHDTRPGGRRANALFRWVMSAVFRFLLRANRHILVPSEFTRQELVQFSGIRESRVSLTYEAAELPDPAITPYPLPRSNFILCVGNFYEYKNVRRLLEAHELLRASGRDVDLVLVGNLHTPGLRLQSELIARGREHVHFTGFVSEAQKNWLFQHCAVYVFPSLAEGFGLPGLEAMLQGAPVVASSATCLPEIYGDAALYFDPLDVHDMAGTVACVLDSEDERDRLIAAGQDRVSQFSWRRMAEQTHALYKANATRAGRRRL